MNNIDVSKSLRYLNLLLFISAMLLSGACSDDDDNNKSITDQQIETLNGSWKATAVTLDGVAQTGYELFTIKFTGTAGANNMMYTIANNPDRSPWPSASGGTVSFDTQQPAQLLIREDDVEIEYSTTNAILTLEFTYQEPSPGGRISSVNGHWQFALQKISTP